MVLKKEKEKKLCASCWRARSLLCDSISPASAAGSVSAEPQVLQPLHHGARTRTTIGEGQPACGLLFPFVLFFAYLIVSNALRGDLVYGFGRKH